METTLRIWAEFGACVLLIGWAGSALARHGDALAAITGLSRNWIGMVLLATVTSLPELVTGLSSVTIADSADVAFGDAAGSCVVNLALLALFDLTRRDGRFWADVGEVHRLSCLAGMAGLAIAAAGLLAARAGAPQALGHVSVFSILGMAGYALAMRTIFRAEPQGVAASGPAPTAPSGLRRALAGYALSAAVIVVAGIWLPLVAVQLARVMGWNDSFVGALFVALATSTPELATTLAAVRLGALDMALGNLLGSNLFDLFILGLDDLAYVAGPIHAAVSPVQLVPLAAAFAMYAVVLRALHRPQAAPGALLLAIFLLDALLLFLLGG